MIKQLKVLMPPSFHKLVSTQPPSIAEGLKRRRFTDDLNSLLIRQPISDELAGCFDASSGGGTGVPGPTALVVSPFGKVWRVDVGRDGDGKFLGRGWADFLAAHGIDRRRLVRRAPARGPRCAHRQGLRHRLLHQGVRRYDCR
jgi:hypothetical protein